jgi:hypothetical protein
VLLIIVLLISNVFALESNTTNANSKIELAKIVFKNEIEKEVEEKTYFEFIEETIPAKFVKPFYDFTHENKKLGIELLGTAKHESGWKVFKGPINSNGTRDYGPLMLNSANLENEEFMKSFSKNCKQYEYDIDIYYMCICINFYKSIRTQYGPWCALQIYNGGWRTMRKSCPENLKRQVIGYANKVYSYINSYESEYKDFSSSRSEKHLNYIALQYSSKVEKYIPELTLFNFMIKNNTVFDLGNENARITLIDRTCIFDEESFELFVLGKCIPEDVLLLTPEDLYLSDDEEFFERLLC